MDSLLQKDENLLWHPYTQHKKALPCLAITKAEGVYLIDENGNKYIDAISSWWTNLHGHAHAYIAEKIYEQALRLEHVIFAGCTHPPAVQLAEKLLPLLPGNMGKLFYSDNGSTAVEVGIKMAIQYWRNKNENKRNKILAFRHSYHGDTFGAMSISERSVFTLAFDNYLFDVVFIDTPCQKNIHTLIAEIKKQGPETLCFIYEPLVQGAGGMRMYDAMLMDEVLSEIKNHGIICIADEVMTGFGRTGKLFASHYLQKAPDIICISKGLTGGALPMAATACNNKIYEAFLSDDKEKTFFHGHSYTANPLGCAAALASLDLLEKEACKKNIELISLQNRQFVNELLANKNLTGVKNPRSSGTIMAFELQSGDNIYLSNIRDEMISRSLNEGVLIRPLGNTIYIMPPYCITKEELGKVYLVLKKIIDRFGS